MKQISILSKGNNPITEVTELLSSSGINIRDLNFQQLGHDGILNLIVDDADKCLAMLIEQGYAAVTDDTLLLKVEDRLGMLAKISRDISNLGVDIRSLTLMGINKEGDVVAVCTTDNDKVRELFQKQLIN